MKKMLCKRMSPSARCLLYFMSVSVRVRVRVRECACACACACACP